MVQTYSTLLLAIAIISAASPSVADNIANAQIERRAPGWVGSLVTYYRRLSPADSSLAAREHHNTMAQAMTREVDESSLTTRDINSMVGPPITRELNELLIRSSVLPQFKRKVHTIKVKNLRKKHHGHGKHKKHKHKHGHTLARKHKHKHRHRHGRKHGRRHRSPREVRDELVARSDWSSLEDLE